jgi:hypothetical protein
MPEELHHQTSKVGQFVQVCTEFFYSTCLSKKLSENYLGPFEIIAKVGSQFFTLCLLDTMHAVHPVFHVSQLKVTTPNTIPSHVQPPLPPVKIDGEPEFEISEILNSKIDNRHCLCKLLYLVQWASYEETDKETSWILASELGHATEILDNFHSAYPVKPGPLDYL